MFYDEKTNTWFESELHAHAYHTTGATWAAEDTIDDIYDEAICSDFVVLSEDYDRMEERAGNYETGCDMLAEALKKLLTGQCTTRADRNALRADLMERLPACVLEETIVSQFLRPERDSRGRVA